MKTAVHTSPAHGQALMKLVRRSLAQITLLLITALLAACSSPSVYKDEKFTAQSPFQKTVALSEAEACEAAQRTLLSQGYRLESIYVQNVRAIKDFQPDDDNYITIDFSVVCMPDKNGATIYVNAVETTYELRKTSGAASLSVPGGGIAMPWGKSTDTLVKVAGKTITDETFYKRFFDLLAMQLR